MSESSGRELVTDGCERSDTFALLEPSAPVSLEPSRASKGLKLSSLSGLIGTQTRPAQGRLANNGVDQTNAHTLNHRL